MEYTPDVKYVRLYWQQLNGMRCVKMIPMKEYMKEDYKLHLCTGAFFSPICYNFLVDGCGAIDEHVEMKPDRSTFKVLPWCPSHAGVMVNIYDHDGNPWKYCPRSQVSQAIDQLAEEHGLEMKIGFEVEFAILNQSFEPVEYNGYSNSNSLDLYALILEDICDSLAKLDIEVQVIHKETGPGQFEIVLGYDTVLKSLDRYFMARETIKAVLRKHGLIGTLIPKSHPITQNGAHVHMSLWKDGENITVDERAEHKISEKANNFFAAVLEALPAMISLIAPTYNGLKRLIPSASVGSTIAWGIENKEAPLRFLPVQNNMELKTLDHTANHYYVLAAIIRLGIIGMNEKKLLSEPLPAAPKINQFKQLPSRWEDVLLYLDTEAGEILKKAMGDELINVNVKVRQYDIDHYFKFTLADEIRELTIRY